jgi:hypothetical protein
VQVDPVEHAQEEKAVEGGMTFALTLIVAFAPLAFVIGLLWPVKPRPYVKSAQNTRRNPPPIGQV